MTLWPSIRSWQFITGVTVLVVAAVTIQDAADAASQALSKRPVHVQKPLSEFDSSVLTDFRYMKSVSGGGAEIAGTDQFFESWFVPVAPDISGVETLFLHAYYYTSEGRPLIIPHTPEVCYRQIGDQVLSIKTITLDVPIASGATLKVPAKCLQLRQDPNGKALDCCVIYTLCVNGEFVSDREVARLKIAMPWNRAVYFTKIEAIASVPKTGEFARAFEAARRIVIAAIPELIDNHLPTLDDIRTAAAASVLPGDAGRE